MARVLKAYTFTADRTGKRGRPALYPWDEWTDGQVWKVTEGIDFKISRNSFRSSLVNHATRNGYTLKVDNVTPATGPKSVIFQFISKKRATVKATRRTRKAAANG
jgi:hypothetical protein